MSGIIYSGYDNNTRFYMRWWLIGQEISNNRSLVGWEIGVQGTAGRTSYWYSNAIRIDSGYVNGAHVQGSQTFSNITLQGDGLRGLRSGSIWIGHNADGAKSFGMSMAGWFYSNGNKSTSGSWALPTIPRNSQVSTNLGSYTLGDPITIITNRKSTSFTHVITIRLHNSGGALLQTINNVGDSTTWTPTEAQITTMQNAIPNSNTLNLYIYQHNNQVNAGSAVNRTLTLTNANPTFADFVFEDTDAATVAITGNNQVLVKGQSVLGVTVPAADKMVAIKGSTPVRYAFAYDGASNQVNYATTDVTSSFSTISTIGTRTIQVTAFDSRTNSTRVSKDITVYDYTAPTITTTLTRENNFDSDTTIHIEGTYTPLSIGGVNKNSLQTGTLQYRYQEDGGAFGSWTTVTFTPNTTTGTFSVTDFVVSLDNQKKFNFEFHIDDSFGTVTTTNSVDIGTPIMFVGENLGVGAVGINKMPENGALDVDGDIYSNGVKLSVDKVAFLARATTTQSVSDSTFTKMTGLSTEVYDHGGGWDTSTSTYTVPVSGVYSFVGVVGVANNSTRLFASIYKNGSEYARGSNGSYTANGNTSQVVYQDVLTAGDTITLYAWRQGAGLIQHDTIGGYGSRTLAGHLVFAT